MLIFLDYDGVLHDCSGENQFCHVPRFESVLREHLDMEVVISSDWRKYAADHTDLIKHFSVDLRPRFIGCTGLDDAPGSPRARERECCLWLLEHGREHERWLVIDDWPDNFGPDPWGKGSVLFTDPEAGLDDNAAAILRTMIADPTPAIRFCYDGADLQGWPPWNGCKPKPQNMP